MGKGIEVREAKLIMGNNFVGLDELNQTRLFSLSDDTAIPSIKFSVDELEIKKDDYMLILGQSLTESGIPVTIRNLASIFGKDPERKEPCFYNQDWYEHESFIDEVMDDGWFLIRKNVYEDSRAVQPLELMKSYSFPCAIKCAYAFFVCWLGIGQRLWMQDFIWCSDSDHNGDRIYVGRYHDPDGVNKNGFNIHRHLALRDCYGCVD